MELDRSKLRLLTSPRVARVEAIVYELKQIRESAADPLYGRGAAPYGFGGDGGGGGAGAPKGGASKPPAKAPAPKPQAKTPAPAPGAK
jgi:hypothetical protein